MRDFEWICCGEEDSVIVIVIRVALLRYHACQMERRRWIIDILRSPERRVSVIILVRNISKGRQVL